MNKVVSQTEAPESRTGAGLAGIGGGTLLTVIAANLPDDNGLKPWLLYLAPSGTILLSTFWIWVQVQLANKIRDKEINFLAENAKTTLKEALENPNISEKHRERLQKQLEEVETITVDRMISRIKSLDVVTAEDVKRANKPPQ
jgi:hypothetical protein